MPFVASGHYTHAPVTSRWALRQVFVAPTLSLSEPDGAKIRLPHPSALHYLALFDGAHLGELACPIPNFSDPLANLCSTTPLTTGSVAS